MNVELASRAKRPCVRPEIQSYRAPKTVPSWWDDKGWLTAFDLAYDEGGEGNTLLVSMQMTKVERGKKLKRHWGKHLKGIEYFHSKEFKNISFGVFKGLNQEQREHMLSKLSTLVHRHVVIGMTAKIDCNLYNERTTNDFRSRWGTAYTFAINMLAMGAFLYFEQFNLPTDINILIEGGHRHSAQAVEVMNDAKKLNDKEGYLHILNVGLGSKKDHPILQAADMLAYSEWQKLTDGNLDIYNALHIESSKYQPEFIDLDQEMIDVVKSNADEWVRKRKEFGRRKTATANT